MSFDIGVLIVQWQQLTGRLSIPPPHTSLIASVGGQTYDSAKSEQSLEAWLATLAKDCTSDSIDS